MNGSSREKGGTRESFPHSVAQKPRSVPSSCRATAAVEDVGSKVQPPVSSMKTSHFVGPD